jgi:hypothetical protein
MARKRFPAVRAKKKASPDIGRPPAAKALSGAHPRLVHGFLVGRIVKPGAGSARATKSTPAPIATPQARIPYSIGTRHEGPADDSTFH